MTESVNGIQYDWELAGPDGARFELHPIRNVHTAEDVAKAKKTLRWQRDVVGISVAWRQETEVAMRDRRREAVLEAAFHSVGAAPATIRKCAWLCLPCGNRFLSVIPEKCPLCYGAAFGEDHRLDCVGECGVQ